MNSRVRSCLVAACMLVAVALTCTTARAQLFFPNPPCGNIVINNLSGCFLNLRFVTAPAVWPGVLGLGPGAVANLPVPAGGIWVNGINSFGGNFYNFIPPPPPPGSPCGAGDWSIPHVSIGPVPCCVDICGLPGQCAIVIRPSPPPPACRP